ncbi:MAG: tetratricopeptide repeat protein [Anaerolineae bacterium]|jgi:Flp pilus assembly protein TadD|nr:tetratricopeptide repeat protein [Anaerolineae bacterium]
MAMGKEQISLLIGDGWTALRGGNTDAALDAFRRVLNDDAENIDAHYGLGLAQRSKGDKTSAKTAFETALRVCERELAQLRNGTNVNDLTTTRDDRYMMLIRMLGQRITEVSA